MSAAETFVIRLGDDFAGPRPSMVKVWPIDRRSERTCRVGIRSSTALGARSKDGAGVIELTAEQLRDLAAVLTQRADAIDGDTPRPEHDQQAAPTDTTGGDA